MLSHTLCSTVNVGKQSKVTQYFTRVNSSSPRVHSTLTASVDSHLLSANSSSPGSHLPTGDCHSATPTQGGAAKTLSILETDSNVSVIHTEGSPDTPTFLRRRVPLQATPNIHKINNGGTQKRKRASPPSSPARQLRFETTEDINALSDLVYLENCSKTSPKRLKLTPKTKKDYTERVQNEIKTLGSIFDRATINFRKYETTDRKSSADSVFREFPASRGRTGEAPVAPREASLHHTPQYSGQSYDMGFVLQNKDKMTYSDVTKKNNSLYTFQSVAEQCLPKDVQATWRTLRTYSSEAGRCEKRYEWTEDALKVQYDEPWTYGLEKKPSYVSKEPELGEIIFDIRKRMSKEIMQATAKYMKEKRDILTKTCARNKVTVEMAIDEENIDPREAEMKKKLCTDTISKVVERDTQREMGMLNQKSENRSAKRVKQADIIDPCNAVMKMCSQTLQPTPRTFGDRSSDFRGGRPRGRGRGNRYQRRGGNSRPYGGNRGGY